MEPKVLRVAFRTADTLTCADMLVIDGIPHVVWEWDGESPKTTTRLDPRYLQTDPAHVPPGFDAVYGRELQNPAKLH